MFVRVLAGERDLITILVSIISILMYISVVMKYVTIRVLNLSSILSSDGCNIHTEFELLTFFLFSRCEETGVSSQVHKDYLVPAFRFPSQTLYVFVFSPVCATRSAHPILLDFIVQLTFEQEYTSCKFFPMQFSPGIQCFLCFRHESTFASCFEIPQAAFFP